MKIYINLILILFFLTSNSLLADEITCKFDPSAGNGKVYFSLSYEMNSQIEIFETYIGQENFRHPFKYRDECADLKRFFSPIDSIEISKKWEWHNVMTTKTSKDVLLHLSLIHI